MDESNWLGIMGYKDNLGAMIVKSLVDSSTNNPESFPFDRIVVLADDDKTEAMVREELGDDEFDSGIVEVTQNAAYMSKYSNVVILAMEKGDAVEVFSDEVCSNLSGKLLISLVKSWRVFNLEDVVFYTKSPNIPWIIRAVPNVAASVGQSMTVIRTPQQENFPKALLDQAETIFGFCGSVEVVSPALFASSSAVTGFSPTFFALIADAVIDAAVVTGMPRRQVQTLVYQSMAATATMMESGMSTSDIRNNNAIADRYTVAGILKMEELGIYGTVGQVLREAIKTACEVDADSESIFD